MQFGASTFIWVSSFSNQTLDIFDRAKAFGFDLIEVCVEDPDAIDLAAIRARITKADLGVTICGAFAPNRDLSSEDETVQKAGLSYLRRCIDFAQALGSPFVSGPMYASVGNTRLLDGDAPRAQWKRSAANLKVAAAYAAEQFGQARS